MTNENIQEYISPEHLLTKYGGYDQWQFNFEVEHEKMMQLIDSYHDVAADDGDDPQDEGLGDDDRLTPVAEEEDDEEMIGGGGGRRERGGGGRKQVRFSSGLPPTRQSRFGRQDEDDIPRSVSPDQQVYLVCIFQP
ncbi:MAG: hypothetical protein MJE68_24905, partial [Proteobacteria bacterium]|nr:hypothetical protein [Pseudomonadota bacterium]